MAPNSISKLLDTVMDTIYHHPQSVFVASACITLLALARFRRNSSTRSLQGPNSTSWLFGVSGDIFKMMNASSLYVSWSKLYGPVYKIPSALGGHAVVLCDPKAIAAVFTKDTFVYNQPNFIRLLLKQNFGNNLLVSEGEVHKRQRRALSSGFSIAAIRKLAPTFLRAAHQVSDSWRAIIDASGESSAVIEIQHWINAVTLDSIGNGGFSHDFEATKGKPSLLQERFEAFSYLKPTFTSMLAFLLSAVFPIFVKLPTKRSKLTSELSESIKEIAVEMLEKARSEKRGTGDNDLNKSILGALLKSETASANIRMDVEEIMAQISLFMLAGYDTTATAISWCIAELAQNPDVQQKLRDELATLGGEDATYEQLSSGLPYLDAIICETLRLHPSAPEIGRQANVDDVLPLTNPIINAKGETIESLHVPAGTRIRIPLGAINVHEDFWGEDSLVFKPSRWIDDGTSRKRTEQISGYRHLLTFSDGPRTCLGRLFAVTEFKAVISVLVRDYYFQLRDPQTKFVLHRALGARPKVEGEDGPFLPMVVGRVKH